MTPMLFGKGRFHKKNAEKSGDLPNRGGGGHPEPNSIFEKKVFQGPHRTILGHPKHVHSQKIKLGVIFFYAEKDQTGVGGSREVWQNTRLFTTFFSALFPKEKGFLYSTDMRTILSEISYLAL